MKLCMNFTNMKKKAGISLIEVLVVITIMAILAVISAPSFQGWIDKETYDRQVGLMFDSLNEARSGMLSEKNCPSGEPSEAWGMKITSTELRLWCRAVGRSDEVVTFNDQDVNDYDFDTRIVLPGYVIYDEKNFGNPVLATDLYLEFLVATKQVRINNDFKNRGMRIQLDYLFLGGVENSICLDRFSHFSFFSDEGDCSEL
jgi:prepilin-type N-terminal cleavage/methylation domain-containing protein